MIRSISIKGVLLGNLAVLLFFAAVAAAIAVVAFAAALASGKTDGEWSAPFIGTVIATPAAGALVGGYIAAQFAKENRLLNGALSTALMILFSIYDDLGGFPTLEPQHPVHIPYALDFISTYSMPLFGMLGAHLASLAEPGTILRWIGAIAAAIGAYFLVLALGVALFVWWRDLSPLYVIVVFAPRFSALAGTYTAPKHSRNEALLISIGLTVVGPSIAAFALASVRHSDAWLLIALANLVGCGVAYWTMRRTLARERLAALSAPFD